ncbi:MAG: MFS transporter [Intestinibacter bartlettii]
MKSSTSDKKFKKNLTLFYIILFLGEFSVTIPHAFVTLYLLSSGISLAQISLMQVFYMLAIIIFEVPSGVLADRYSKKLIFIISMALMCISYVLYIKIDCFYIIAFAQFIYGMASALNSGTIDSILLNQLSTKDNDSMEIFTRNSNMIVTSAMVFGSFIGSLLFNKVLGSYVYLIAILGFILSALISLKLHEDKLENKSIHFNASSLVKHFKDGFKSITSNLKLFKIITLIALLQFVLQPFFNYWQPLSVNKGFDGSNLTYIYILMQFFGILASYLYKYLTKVSYHKVFLIINIILLTILMILSVNLGSYTYLVILLISILPRSFILINLNYKLQKNINNNIRSTVTSISSSYSRIISMTALIIMSVLNSFNFKLNVIITICVSFYLVSSLILISLKLKVSKSTSN